MGLETKIITRALYQLMLEEDDIDEMRRKARAIIEPDDAALVEKAVTDKKA